MGAMTRLNMSIQLGFVCAVLCAGGCRRDGASNAPVALEVPKPNIVLITLESIRPQHLSLNGYGQLTSPNIDALASQAIVYDNAYSVTSWTLTSHASIFTGLYPTAHQVLKPADPLADAYTTVAEVLDQEGYFNAGFVSGPFLKRPYRLDQGFHLYDDSPSETNHEVAHGDITNPAMEDGALRFLRSGRPPDQPFFLFMYVWDPHYDYIPPAPYDIAFVPPGADAFDVTRFANNEAINPDMPSARLKYVVSQYDGEIRCTDEMLGRVFKELKVQGLWDNTAVIVTSDHGEEFFEHGSKGHKNNIFVESVHVPLVVKPPTRTTARRDERIVSLVDLFPTVLDIADATTTAPFHGRSLLKPPPDHPRPIFFELLSTWYRPQPPDGQMKLFSDRWLGIRHGDLRLVGRPEKNMWQMFDVVRDPQEKSPLPPDRRADMERLGNMLREYELGMKQLAKRWQQAAPVDLSAEERRRLEALGYIGTSPTNP